MNTWKVSDKQTLRITEDHIGIIKNNQMVERSSIDDKKVFKIPFSYINLVEITEGRDVFTVYFREDAYQTLKIANTQHVNEIIDSLKSNPRFKNYEYRKNKIFQLIKKPLIAGLVLTVIFALAFYSAVQLEAGYGIQNHVLIVWLAGLGSNRLVSIYSTIMAVIGISISVKIRRNSLLHKFTFS